MYISFTENSPFSRLRKTAWTKMNLEERIHRILHHRTRITTEQAKLRYENFHGIFQKFSLLSFTRHTVLQNREIYCLLIDVNKNDSGSLKSFYNLSPRNESCLISVINSPSNNPNLNIVQPNLFKIFPYTTLENEDHKLCHEYETGQEERPGTPGHCRDSIFDLWLWTNDD